MGARPLIIVAVAAVAAPVAAQPAPTFTYGKPDDVKDVKAVDWTATTEAGLLVTTGNSKTTTVSATARGTRLDANNKLEVTGTIAYARSTILIAADEDASGTIGPDEIQEATATTANSWQGKIRYDRFLTEFNSLYATAAVGVDEPAGKDLVAAAQAGYSRRLYKDERHEAVAEIGYDFTYEDLAVGDPLSIHSVRAFVGYKGTVRTDTAVEGSVESLSNLNTLATVPDEAGAFEDTRITGIAALTTKLTADISFGVSFTAKFDNVPAPLPPIGGIPYDAGFVPVAEKLDTITKASLIVSFF